MREIEFKTYFDEKKEHRYQLVRGTPEKVICFLMLNPSNADSVNDDPTIKRVKAFSNSFGYTGFIVVNLFSAITHDLKVLHSFLGRDYFIVHHKKADTHIKYAFEISDSFYLLKKKYKEKPL